jgi:hypothetical protein
MNLSNFLPSSGLPPTNYPAGQEVKWLFDHEFQQYKDSGAHSLYGENDIIYRFNAQGYRCPEFDASADIRIVAIGCSYVLGYGLPQHALFHEIFAEKLRAMVSPKTVVVWNLGRCGMSNDYINRMLYLAVPQLKPHIVLINFTHLSRREYLSVQGKYVSYNPTFKPKDEVVKDILSHFAALSSPFDDQMNFFRNYKGIECLLTGDQWLYSQKKDNFEPLVGHLDVNRLVGYFQILDKARDNSHPGPDSHRRLAELYWAKFNELGGLPA